MQHLFRKRVNVWRLAVALVLAMTLGVVVPQAAFADEIQQPAAVGIGGPPDGGKPPHRKCNSPNGARQPDKQCGW